MAQWQWEKDFEKIYGPEPAGGLGLFAWEEAHRAWEHAAKLYAPALLHPISSEMDNSQEQ